ncbi:MAG: heavy-metal-associated domain-containing protein [Thaumarchaeota archaeon]|nr:heavy-metal-associated domain-containing protein [Nitrososphaerota archaeon]
MKGQDDMLAISIFSIEDADRPGQAERVRKALKGMPGIRGVEINYLLDTAKVNYDPNKLSLARIKAALK